MAANEFVLKCDLYDYLEIACLFRLNVTLSLIDGQHYSGIAKTIQINPAQGECLVFSVSDSAIDLAIPLSKLVSMTALTDNPHFSQVSFLT